MLKNLKVWLKTKLIRVWVKDITEGISYKTTKGHSFYLMTGFSSGKHTPGYNVYFDYLFWAVELISLKIQGNARTNAYSDGLMQDRRNFIANTLKLRLSRVNPSIYFEFDQ